METLTKQCRICKTEQQLTNYAPDSRTKDKYKNACNNCITKNHPEKPKKTKEMRAALAKILEECNRLTIIYNFIDLEDFDDVNMTHKIKKFRSSIENNLSKIEEEYKKVLNPPRNEFYIDNSDIILRLGSDYTIISIKSKLQMFLALKKGKIGAMINVDYKDSIYFIKLPEGIFLESSEICQFFIDNKIVADTYTYSPLI
jgi:hypothetical protein